LHLKTFFGAGSTASAFLEKIDVKGKRGTIPDEMHIPVASAFFGGRFENSFSGPVQGPCYNYDISSAYPYHAALLPCLEHGDWARVEDPSIRDIERATLALVHWTTPIVNGDETALRKQAWGAFPVRAKTGTIAFPLRLLIGTSVFDFIFFVVQCAPKRTFALIRQCRVSGWSGETTVHQC
jgi:hypothetical protein